MCRLNDAVIHQQSNHQVSFVPEIPPLNGKIIVMLQMSMFGDGLSG